MKELFPDLAEWKTQGFNKFPPIPHHAILEEFCNAVAPIPAYKLRQAIANAASEPSQQSLLQTVFHTLEKEKEKTRLQAISELEERLTHCKTDADVIKALRGLKRNLFGSRQGGFSFTPSELQILKWYYKNIQQCLEAFWRRCQLRFDMPLRYDGSDEEWKEWNWIKEPEEIKRVAPDITDIFTNEELVLLTKYPSRAKIATEIILERLKKTGKERYQVSPESFRNNMLPKVSSI